MKRHLLALLALFSLAVTASADPRISIGDSGRITASSKGWVGNTYTLLLGEGSATIVRGDASWELYLDNAFVSKTVPGYALPACIVYDGGTSDIPLHVVLSGSNSLWGSGLRAQNCSLLTISGPGALSTLVSELYGISISSSGDLLIHLGASISSVQLSDSGIPGSYAAIDAAGSISIVDASVSVIHSGAAIGYGSIGCGGDSLSIIGSVVAVCADVPSRKGAIRVANGELFVSHSGVTVFANAPGFVADSVAIDTSAVGIASLDTGILAADLVVENTAGLVIADGNAVETETAELRSGNNLSFVGNAEAEYAWSAAIHLTRRDGLFVHTGGRTQLFAPGGTAFLADGDSLSSHAGTGDLVVRGGTLTVAADPDWPDIRKYFTASSVAHAAGAVLAGTVSEDAYLSLLQNFFASEMVDAWLACSALRGSSEKPARGLFARRMAFLGGTTDVTCRTDADGIVHAGSASVSGGKVCVNGKPWTPAVTVSLDANGGTVSRKSVSVRSGGSIGTLPKPIRKGYAFAGWFTARNGGAAVTSTTKFSGNATVHAHWAKAIYRVKFLPNGGKGKMSAQKMAYGKAARLKANKFKRDGHVFLGWAKAKKGALAYKNRQAVKNLTSNGGAVKLYAKWGKKAKVTFAANGGRVRKKSKSATTGKKLGKLPTPTRKNWTFDGWWTKKSGGKRITASTVVKKAMKVYAHWSPIVTLMLDPNGGSIAKRTLKCRTYLGSGGSFYLSTSWSRQSAYTPVRKSHWFTQWNNQRSGGVSLWRIAVSKPVSLTLYAQWEEASHSFHFDTIYWIDDVIQWGFDRTVREGCSIGTLPTPSLDGFRFLGWWTKPDGMGYRVTSGMKAEDLEHISDGTVYAHWEKNPTVSFYSSDSLVATWSFAVGEPMGSLPTPPPPGPNYTIWTWIDEKGNRVTEETIFDGSFETLRASWMIPGTPIAPTNGG